MLWFPRRDDAIARRHITRFDPAFWTVNFPRPMMAAITTPGGDALDVTLVFTRKEDLAGLIWESEDRFDHPLLAYETRRDYRGVTLSFRWQSSGLKPLDQINGPTLTIEGRDPAGNPKSWFVRLWNYAVGTPEDAVITLDFDSLVGGFQLPDEADPVHAGDIDRLFISLIPPAFDGVSSGPLEDGAGGFAPVTASLSLTDIRVRGAHAELELADDHVAPHTIRIANGYDDTFNLAPERILRNLRQLGYRERITHYVGMSHYYRLAWDAAETRFVIDANPPVLNAASEAWHRDFFARLAAMDFTLVLSVSFELLAENAPNDWSQRAFDGTEALTGWVPPSTLIAPTSPAALQYIKDVFAAFGTLMADAGLPPLFQIGEPWWWVPEGGARVPHFYDATTTALYTSETGRPLPPMHQSAIETPSAEQQLYLDWLGAKLGAATLAVRDHLKNLWPSAEVGLLFFTPQVLDESAPMLESVNFPTASWAAPAFDFLQIEDYSHVIAGAWGKRSAALDKVEAALGYSLSQTRYFVGFVLDPADAFIWRNMERALSDARARSFGERVIWAYPQLVRDGALFFEPAEETDMQGFHDVRLPETLSFGSRGGPRFSTNVVVTASGHERRNQDWADARAEYDIATGIRSTRDLADLLDFFRARQGRAFAFRFKDWMDHSSASRPDEPVTPFDQPLGSGDGNTLAFALVKQYGTAGGDPQIRRITRPVAGSVRIAIDGGEVTSGWSLDPATGIISFDTPPAAGAVLTAGFEFDVPVRFASDRLEISLEAFEAGEVPSVPLIEIREA
ncbi:MAG: TIGR02217 family protein [Alphaproteobacteria bacterium]|nr:MAG: TIGR02217 family protein [Alphaproteobacteria bacterium]